jgi:hypothetical protein
LPVKRLVLIFVSTTALAVFLATASSATTAPKSWKVALGGNNPSPGDCTTNSKEKVKAVGSVALIVTSNTFKAEIRLEHGLPKTTFEIYMQQVPGSCPQSLANGGTLISSAAGGGMATATVPRVRGATTFFVQLVTSAGQAPTYTSDRVSIEP